MEKEEEELIRSLIDKEGELKRYYQEHIDLEKRLSELQEKSMLSTEEEIEETRLKKRKLLGKDKIIEILDRHRGKKLPSV